MPTWSIVLIVIAVILVLAGLGVLIWWLVKRSKIKKPVVRQSDTDSGESKPITVQLTAVKLNKGKGITGYETEDELKARVSTLSIQEFKALEIIDFPYGQNEWDALGNDAEKIMKRNEYEMGVYFAYDSDKKLKENNVIVRTF